MAEEKFRLDWFAGPSAQVEIFSPESNEENVYSLKYTPPFRSTIRPPVDKQPLGTEELKPVNEQLNDLFKTLDSRQGSSNQSKQMIKQINDLSRSKMEMFGSMLMTLAIPQYIFSDLRREKIFLEIGMEAKLLDYPWELMHDGDKFLCLKHAVGRFVNSTKMPIPHQSVPILRMGTNIKKLSVLVISVPKPQIRNGRRFDALSCAKQEAEEICEIINEIDGVEATLLLDQDASFNGVYKAINEGEFHIIHFSGHAYFNKSSPHLSGLVLFDRDITTGQITRFFSKRPPILCFINACETTRQAPKGWENRYDIFGLAQAFLYTDAYLLGSRWEINDKAATTFSGEFYKSLLRDNESIGMSILRARKECKRVVPDDVFAWASYVYYGDPRVCFCRI